MAESRDAYPVTRMTSASGFAALRPRATSRPEPSPRFLSMIATSISSPPYASASASFADPASSSRRPSASRNRRSTSRITGASSTIRMVAMEPREGETHAGGEREGGERLHRRARGGEHARLEERRRDAAAPPGAGGEPHRRAHAGQRR